jgi:transposase
MHINYPARISEPLETLESREHELRGKRPVERIRMLRLLKTRQAGTLQQCADLLGYSHRQVSRWWAQYQQEGIDDLLRLAPAHGRRGRMTAQAWQDLQEQMKTGQIARLQDAQEYLHEHWGISYSRVSSLSWRFQQQHVKLKTGRRLHRKSHPEQQDQLKKTSETC